MPEQHRHLANNYEDIVNLQGAEAYCVATRTACYIIYETNSLHNLHSGYKMTQRV